MVKGKHLMAGMLVIALLGMGSVADAAILSLSSSPTLSGAYNQITVTPSTPFTFYVVAHDFSPAELLAGIFGYEFRVNFGDPGFSITSLVPFGIAPLNVGDKYNLIVGTGAAMALSNPTVLGTFQAEYMGTPPTNHLVTLGPSTPSSFGGAPGWLQPNGTYVPFSSWTSMTVNSTGEPVIPEPTTLTLLGLGLAGAGVTRWRKRKA